jgi:hypothetical protein
MDNLSELWTVSLSDWWRGLIVAVLAAILQPILTILQGGGLVFDWQDILTVGLAAGTAYILKNLSTSADGKVLGGKVSLSDSK